METALSNLVLDMVVVVEDEEDLDVCVCERVSTDAIDENGEGGAVAIDIDRLATDRSLDRAPRGRSRDDLERLPPISRSARPSLSSRLATTDASTHPRTQTARSPNQRRRRARRPCCARLQSSVVESVRAASRVYTYAIVSVHTPTPFFRHPFLCNHRCILPCNAGFVVPRYLLEIPECGGNNTYVSALNVNNLKH